MASYMNRYDQMRRVSELERDLVQHVADYFIKFRKPLPLQLVSARFSRTLAYYNASFKETILDLAEQGLITRTMTETGGYVIGPGLTKWDSNKK